jgi:hypothetical protein
MKSDQDSLQTNNTRDQVNFMTIIDYSPEDTKLFLEMSMAERRQHIRELMLAGKHPDENYISVRQILDRGSYRKDTEREYYQYRIQMENIDPAVAAPEIKTNQARFFLESYGLERAKPFLSSYSWMCAYRDSRFRSSVSGKTNDQIKTILLERGAEQLCEEIHNRTPSQIRRMNLSVLWGQSFIEIFGLKAVEGLPQEMARRFKSRHLENALGL